MPVSWRRGRRQPMPEEAYIDEDIFDPGGSGNYDYLYVDEMGDYIEVTPTVETLEIVVNGADHVINGTDRVIV